MLRVGQVMTRLSICLYNHNTIGDALALMREKKVAGLPMVNEQGHLLGMVTKEQILEKDFERITAGDKVIDYVTPRYIPLKEDTLVEEAWDLPFEIFPVLNSQEEITGIVSKYALGQAYFQETFHRRQEMEAVFNSTHSGILAINKQGIITSLNPAAERPTRFTGKEAVGRLLNEVVIQTGLLNVVSTGVPEFGIKFEVGKRKYITNRTPIIKDGEVIGAVGVFQDISELELISNELRSVKALNEELTTIVDSSYDGIIICDSVGEILRCNPAVERILGTSRGVLVGKPFKELIDREIVSRNIIHLAKKQFGPVSIVENPFGDHSIVITCNPVIDEDGEIVKFVINIRDMTELEGLREALEESKQLSEKFQSEIAQMRTRFEPSKDVEFRSGIMRNVYDLALRVSKVETPVVIIGESSVGKIKVARFIHNNSERSEGPFLKLDCSSLPDQVLEAELFGYAPDSSSGASKKAKAGIFEHAHKGTVYLEEIGHLPPAVQSKLLQLLRDKEVMPIGGLNSIPVDVRIITTTQLELSELVKQGFFKEELFFRLNVVSIEVPPLRERKEDVVPLLHYYQDYYNRRYSLKNEFSSEAVNNLLNYDWPGNLREVANVVERLVVTTGCNS